MVCCGYGDGWDELFFCCYSVLSTNLLITLTYTKLHDLTLTLMQICERRPPAT